MSIEVYQTDLITNLYVGTTTAFESPREPGVYLIPAGAYTEAPPTIPEGQGALWNGTTWELVDIIDEGDGPVVDDRPLIVRVKEEVSRRIQLRASTNTQINLTANMAAGNFDAEDIAAYEEAVEWVAEMRAIGQALVISQDETFKDDIHWPNPTQAAIALALLY